MNNNISSLPVAIIGAGPVGLVAAARIIERRMEPHLLEAGPKVVEHFRQYGHVRLFSPWRHNVDKAASRLLQKRGWIEPDPEQLPTAGEMVERYLEPLAGLPEFADRLWLRTRVLKISRDGCDKVKTKGREHGSFVIRIETSAGQIEEVRARAIIDASGTWSSLNPLGVNGMPAPDWVSPRIKTAFTMAFQTSWARTGRGTQGGGHSLSERAIQQRQPAGACGVVPTAKRHPVAVKRMRAGYDSSVPPNRRSRCSK